MRCESLFNIENEYKYWCSQLLESLACDNEYDERIDFDEKLSINKEKLHYKSDSCAYVINSLKCENETIKKEVDRLKKRADINSKAIKMISGTLIDAVDTFGKFKTDFHTFSIITSESVIIIDEKEVPRDYIKEKILISADKIKIKDAIKSGEYIPGVRLAKSTNIKIK